MFVYTQNLFFLIFFNLQRVILFRVKKSCYQALPPKSYVGNWKITVFYSQVIINWLVVSNSRDAQAFQEFGRSLLNVGRLLTTFLAMACLNPMNLADVDLGSFTDLVCTVKVFDPNQAAHLLVSRTDSVVFLFDGILDESFTTFTLFKVSLVKFYPIPLVVAQKDSMILGHHKHTWESLHTVVDFCSGFGGLAQGAEAAGFDISVAVDQNQLMLDLHRKMHDAHCIHGDIGDRQVVHEVWSHSRGAAVVSSGFSCQPFSRLGDGKSHMDSRASCLTKTLNSAFYLNAAVIVLECVAPAANDSFVQSELERFCKISGFHLSVTELKLDHVWPCRRHRAWWVLTSPDIGKIPLQPWPVFTNLFEVNQIIPEIRLWDSNDEDLLALDDVELDAFGVNCNSHAKHLLNGKSVAPCALHAWGSQTRACPCGCRKTGFSCQRLESKGLHGCIVRSAVQMDGSSRMRHLHPNEAMGLNTVDPVIDCGLNVRLTLSAVGQLACPIQALWIFAAIAKQLDEMRAFPVFNADAQMQAFRSWLLSRCRQVWPCSVEPVQDPKLVSMMQFWNEHKGLSLRELLFPLRWEGKIDGSVCIASVLDFLIRSREFVPPTIQEPSEGDDATPWFEFPVLVENTVTPDCLSADSCTVVFECSSDSPVRFQPKCCVTVAQFLQAHEKLVGKFGVAKISMGGQEIGLDHVMEVGQVITISVDHAAPSVDSSSDSPIVVSPTAPWSQAVHDPIEIASPPRKVSKFDVGQCTLPSPDMPDQAWLDATPFLQLEGDQFLKLTLPSITTVQQLWSVRHQFFRTEDRIQILSAQGPLMADDEIRFHLHALTIVHRDHLLNQARRVKPICVIDPLLASAWTAGRGFDCTLWAKDHPEIKSQGLLIITAVHVNQHWIPVFMSPVQDVLHACTWDAAEACHDCLNHVIHALASGLGFSSALISREHRLFFTSNLCGALAIVFLRAALVGTLLPTDCNEAWAVHTMLRDRFVAILQGCQITDRPWIWGAGVDNDPEPKAAAPSVPLTAVVNVTRDERIDLINSNGFAMGDDEIRFHLLNLVQNQVVPSQLIGRTFVFFDSLVYSCWTSIGRTITEQWCVSHLEVRSQGKSIVTAFAIDGHWTPFWMSPRGNMLQVHTLQSTVDLSRVEEIMEVIIDFLDFRAFSIHRVPDALPSHMMCGAHAMSFIAHVIMNMPLPEDLQELRTLHTNMRASFVAHLYSVEATPRPVIWGNGLPGEYGPLPKMPAAECNVGSSHDRPCQPAPSGATHSWEPSGSRSGNGGESGPLPIMPVPAPGRVVPADQPASSSDVHVSPLPPGPVRPSEVPQARQPFNKEERLLQVTSHGYAMADDEAHFQLMHLAECQHPDNPRQFVVLPPLAVIKWQAGDDVDLRSWIVAQRHRLGTDGFHVYTMLLLEQHWIPVWIAPCHGGVMVHSLADFAGDEGLVDQVLSLLVHKCGSSLQVIHRVPHGLPVQRQCGVMSVCFLAHVIMGTRMPATMEDVYDRCWAMKQVFADAITNGLVTVASHWGWGVAWESRPLPIMPVWGPLVTKFWDEWKVFQPAEMTWDFAARVLPDAALGITVNEMVFHLSRFVAEGSFPVSCHTVPSLSVLKVTLAGLIGPGGFAGALLHEAHWSPVLAWRSESGHFVIAVEGSHVANEMNHEFPHALIHCMPAHEGPFCGAFTWKVLAHVWGCRHIPDDLSLVQGWLQSECQGLVQPDVRVGFGSHAQLLKNLASELAKHGVPPNATEDRARSAIKALGSEQLLEALNHRQPWRQLKILGNNSKFQFVLPSELAIAVEANKGKSVSTKGRGKGKAKPAPQAVDLDPTKLQILEGTFKSHDRTLSQLSMKQIGPLSSGVILMSHQDAEPYLKAGKLVSQDPLALLVLPSSGQDVRTILPHGPVTVPCRCTVNNEPVLADAIMVQVGQGLVEKAVGPTVVTVDTPDVVTLKVLVYKDELKIEWGEFCQSPIKCLVSLLPKLKRCLAPDCQCPGWHNAEQLPIRDPILDVWRRQFLRQGFKPCPPDQAEFFSVCLRIPQCLMESLLSSSGAAGAYCEPRTADGKEVLPDYTVVWTPRHSHQEIQHLMQTNPAVSGLVRLGDRRGLRVCSSQAKGIHQLVRPDAIFLPSGPKCQFSAGPFPYGADRQAVGKVLAQAGWECRPLQPSTPCPGKGVMWLIQSTIDLAQPIISTTSGDIMISKIKHEASPSVVSPTTVGSVATLALCEKQSATKSEVDPWAFSDPWKQYQSSQPAASGPNVGLQQIEDRIQTAVLSKLQQPMEQDDLPDRVQALEGQVQQLLGKQQGLEAQFHEHSAQHTQQISNLQGQVAAQSQQLHGHLENQNQTIQSLFEQQMQQIRGLLAKRPRDDSLE